MIRRKRRFFLSCFFVLFIPFGYFFAQSEEASSPFDQHKARVISIVAFDKEKIEVSRGTGFAIGKDIVATNYHLVSQAKAAQGMDSRGKEVKIEGIIAHDKENDLAILQAKIKAPPLGPGDFNKVQLDSDMVVIGVNEAEEIRTYQGKVVNLVEFAPGRKTADVDIAATSSVSGAPVFDSDGELMGFMIYLDSRTKFVLPASLLDGLKKSSPVTKFKKWEPEDYFSTLEGAYLGGKLAAALENTNKAVTFLRQVIKLKPDDLEVLFLLAETYTKQRSYSSSVSTYKKILELDPQLDDAYLEMGIIYVKMMQWSDAVAALEKSLELNADNTRAYSHLGKAYEEQKIFDKAAASYQQYLKAHPETPEDVALSLGICYMELEQFEDAILAFSEALKANPEHLNTNYKLAQAYQKAGQLEKAEETYRALAELSPEDAKIYFNTIIRMYDDAKMPDKAIGAAQRLIEIYPNDSEAYYNLGYMHVKLKNYKQAIEIFKKTVEIRPEFEYAYMNLGYCYSQMKNHEEAVNAFKKVVEIVPNSSDGWFNMGINYMQQKNWESAVEPLRKTIELRPDYGLAYYNLGIAYLNLHDNYSATDVYNKLTKINADLASKLKKYLR